MEERKSTVSLAVPLLIFTLSLVFRKIGWSFAPGLILLTGIWITVSCLMYGWIRIRFERHSTGRWIFPEEILLGICFALIMFKQQYWLHGPGMSRIAGILFISGYLYKVISERFPSQIITMKKVLWPAWLRYYFIALVFFLLISGIFFNPRQFHNFFRMSTYEEYLRGQFPELSIEDADKLLLAHIDRSDASKSEAVRLSVLAKNSEMERDYIKALRFYNLSIDKDPENAEVYFQRGRFKISRLELNKGLAWSAVIDFTESIRLRPEHAASYYQRGAIYSYLDKKDSTCQDMHIAFRLNPELDVLHFVKRCCPEDSGSFIPQHF